MSLARRLWSRVGPTPPPAGVVVDGDCWLWTGAVDSAGYGKMDVDGRTVSTHRVAYMVAHGGIPEGRWIDHLCGVRLCCQPSHLEAVEPAENDLRARRRAQDPPPSSSSIVGTWRRPH